MSESRNTRPIPPKAQEIIEYRAQRLTLAEIGRRVGITKEAVRQQLYLYARQLNETVVAEQAAARHARSLQRAQARVDARAAARQREREVAKVAEAGLRAAIAEAQNLRQSGPSLARQLGVPAPTLYNRARKMGLPFSRTHLPYQYDVPRSYTYRNSCVTTPADEVPLLDAMVASAHEISYGHFIRLVGYAQLQRIVEPFGYATRPCDGLTLRRDRMVSYYRSMWGSTPCVFFTHSHIEYYFVKDPHAERPVHDT